MSNPRPLPEHGTWQRYANKRRPCRDECCRAAWRHYQNGRSRQIAYGRRDVDPLVSASHARMHLLILRGERVGICTTVAELTGLSASTLDGIASGAQRLARRSTVDKILAVTVEQARANLEQMPDYVVVDDTGTRRRVQALIAIGWSLRQLAPEVGIEPDSLGRLAHQTKKGGHVRVSTKLAVDELYRRLWGTPPVPHDRYSTAAATRSRKLAAEMGWAPPLAWDDDTIDDPTCEPEWEAMHRRPVRTSIDVAAELEDLLDVVDPTITAEQASARLGYRDAQSIYLALKRANRPDLRARLDRNNEAANPTPLITKADAYGRKPSRKDTAA